ncbi:MAG: hypothetical protein LBG97_06460, partial [Coriobacteriales bacterium]|nr:hypothetical protein [Coriobacteriales bacterium]
MNINRTLATEKLEASVSSLREVGAMRQNALADLGIFSVRDMLAHYPFRYNDFTNIVNIANAKIGARVVICGRVDEVKQSSTAKGTDMIKAAIFDGTGIINVTWFGQPWLIRQIVNGAALLVMGVVDHFNGYKQLNSPAFTVIPNAIYTEYKRFATAKKRIPATVLEQMGARIEPIYPASAKISSQQIAKIAKDAVMQTRAVFEYLPTWLRIRRNLMTRGAAIRAMHFPYSIKESTLARRRLAYDEVLMSQLLMMRNRSWQQRNCRAVALGASDEQSSRIQQALKKLVSLLSFTLTAEQDMAINSILSNIALNEPMNRLLLGDVGCGKTIVAMHALVATATCGYQAAMIAPTVVLAQQYAIKCGYILDSMQIRWGLLTGA